MSIREVAKRARVSIATVSRTVNNAPGVDPKTAERVRRAIKELSYYPDKQARSLVSGRSHILGLIVSDITNPFFPELVKGLEDVASPRGYEILVSSTNYDPARTALCVRRMLERKVEGVAVMTSEMDQPLIDELERRRIPTVFLDVGPARGVISNIQVDYASGISQAVGYLRSLGHRSIGFISGPLRLKSARSRRSAFLACARPQREDEALIEEGDHTVEGGLAATARLLARPEPPTAILASNDLTAIGAMRAVRRAGLRVPEDVSIIGFDDIHLARFTEPQLTTVALSRAELAEKAVDALIGRAGNGNGKPVHGAEYRVTPALVVRDSACAPRAGRLALPGPR
jgi:LacI family transcriptional regulator